MRSVRFEPITPNTITSAVELQRQIQTVRREGVAYCFEEYTPGIIGMAVPVLSKSGYPARSLNVAMPSVRSSPWRQPPAACPGFQCKPGSRGY